MLIYENTSISHIVKPEKQFDNSSFACSSRADQCDIFPRVYHKVNIIQYLINKYRIEESIFVDDMEEHLIASEAIEGLSTMQAKWGYVIPEKKEDNSVSLLKELEVFINGKNVWA